MSIILLAVPAFYPVSGELNDVHEFSSPYSTSVATSGLVTVSAPITPPPTVGPTSSNKFYYSPSQVIYVEV